MYHGYVFDMLITTKQFGHQCEMALILNCLILWPAEILSNEVIEPLIMLDEELPELGDDCRVDPRVLTTLRFPQTFVCRVVPQAIKAFRFVEVKILSSCWDKIMWIFKHLAHKVPIFRDKIQTMFINLKIFFQIILIL